ncbi:MAG: hypothetical protein Q8Q48_00915 [Candidatus Staskawiczbacteria bacterium]|nr:hypothetical protein [Candidatus Staskawiczbacteria bacterium]
MKVVRHEDIEKDLKNLRRFPAPKESLDAWERLFCWKGLSETPAIEAFPGFGECKLYKGRVVAMKENVGKAKGYRVIFQMIVPDCCKIIVFFRHGIYKTEQELMNIIKGRIIKK